MYFYFYNIYFFLSQKKNNKNSRKRLCFHCQVKYSNCQTCFTRFAVQVYVLTYIQIWEQFPESKGSKSQEIDTSCIRWISNSGNRCQIHSLYPEVRTQISELGLLYHYIRRYNQLQLVDLQVRSIQKRKRLTFHKLWVSQRSKNEVLYGDHVSQQELQCARFYLSMIVIC